MTTQWRGKLGGGLMGGRPETTSLALNHLAISLAHNAGMTRAGFDAMITLNDRHLAAAGLTGHPAEAVAAVRRAVQRVDGAGYIDIEEQSGRPPHWPGWVAVYPLGRSITPDTPEWRELRHAVEAVALAALTSAGASV
jgi:hypothetical protein